MRLAVEATCRDQLPAASAHRLLYVRYLVSLHAGSSAVYTRKLNADFAPVFDQSLIPPKRMRERNRKQNGRVVNAGAIAGSSTLIWISIAGITMAN